MTDSTRGLSADMITDLLIDTTPYLSCDSCFAQLDEYIERRLADPRYQDPAMEAHLAGCGACAEEGQTLWELLSDDVR